MNYKKTLLLTLTLSFPLLGYTFDDFKGFIKTTAQKAVGEYAWVTATAVGLVGSIFIYRHYSKRHFLKNRFANLKTSLEKNNVYIDAISKHENTRIQALRDALIKEYTTKPDGLEPFKKATANLKIQLTLEQQEVTITLKERGEKGQKELKEAFGDEADNKSIDSLYHSLLTTLAHLEQQIPFVQSFFLLKKNIDSATAIFQNYKQFLNKTLSSQCDLLMSSYKGKRQALTKFAQTTRSYIKELQCKQQECLSTIRTWDELAPLYDDFKHYSDRVTPCLNDLVHQTPYVHGALFLQENPATLEQLTTLYHCLNDNHTFRAHANSCFRSEIYPFIALSKHLEGRISEVNRLISSLPNKHAIQFHKDTTAHLNDHLKLLTKIKNKVLSSRTYDDERYEYKKEQERLRRIQEEEARLRRLEEERQRREAELRRLQQQRAREEQREEADRLRRQENERLQREAELRTLQQRRKEEARRYEREQEKLKEQTKLMKDQAKKTPPPSAPPLDDSDSAFYAPPPYNPDPNAVPSAPPLDGKDPVGIDPYASQPSYDPNAGENTPSAPPFDDDGK